jgi:hypothetical protein
VDDFAEGVSMAIPDAERSRAEQADVAAAAETTALKQQ